MKSILIKTLFCCLAISNFDIKAQSIIKFISGTVTETTNDSITKPIYGINTLVNNSSILNISDYIIIEINNSVHKISNDEYPDGFLISSFSKKNKEIQNNSFWNKIYQTVFSDKFGNEKEIEDGLYMSDFQGISRDINVNKNVKNIFICNEYKSKIDWSGTNILISLNNDILFQKIKKKSEKTIIKINTLDNCSPCEVIIDGKKSGQITSKTLSKKDKIIVDYLLENINSNVEVEFSQYCLFNIFIQNQLFLNARYCQFKYNDNKMIRQYFSDIISF